MPKVEIDNELLLKKVMNGNKLEDVYNYPEFMFIYNNDVLAIYKQENGLIKPVKVFNNNIEMIINNN